MTELAPVRQADLDAPVRVRGATADERVMIAHVWRAAWLDGHRGHVPEELLAARDKEYFFSQLAARLSSTLVAADLTGRVLGMVITAEDELFQLAVDGATRRRGVGAALLNAAESRISVDGHQRAWLSVIPENSRARRLYARYGWQDTGLTTYAAPAATGTVPVRVHRYEKTLADGEAQ